MLSSGLVVSKDTVLGWVVQSLEEDCGKHTTCCRLLVGCHREACGIPVELLQQRAGNLEAERTVFWKDVLPVSGPCCC
jgi:hypothetical protein